jgi:hypothetical protein
MRETITTIFTLTLIGYVGYYAWTHFEWTHFNDPVIHWDSTTDLEVIPGTYHDGIFRAWTKERISRDSSGKATPGMVLTIEFDCKKAQFRNVAFKVNNGSLDPIDAPWSNIQPDSAEARLLAEGCKNRK